VALVGTPFSVFSPGSPRHPARVAVDLRLVVAAPASVPLSRLGIVHLVGWRRRSTSWAMSVYAFSVSLILFSFSRSLPLSDFVLMLVGASNIAIRAVANTVVQMKRPQFVGRMLSLYFMDKRAVVLWHSIHRQRRSCRRHAAGHRNLRSGFRCGGPAGAALPAKTGAEKINRRKSLNRASRNKPRSIFGATEFMCEPVPHSKAAALASCGNISIVPVEVCATVSCTGIE